MLHAEQQIVTRIVLHVMERNKFMYKKNQNVKKHPFIGINIIVTAIVRMLEYLLCGDKNMGDGSFWLALPRP